MEKEKIKKGKSVIKKKYNVGDPEFQKFLKQIDKNPNVLSLFFQYDEGPPRTLKSIEVLLRDFS